MYKKNEIIPREFSNMFSSCSENGFGNLWGMWKRHCIVQSIHPLKNKGIFSWRINSSKNKFHLFLIKIPFIFFLIPGLLCKLSVLGNEWMMNVSLLRISLFFLCTHLDQCQRTQTAQHLVAARERSDCRGSAKANTAALIHRQIAVLLRLSQVQTKTFLQFILKKIFLINWMRGFFCHGNIENKNLVATILSVLENFKIFINNKKEENWNVPK